MGIKEKLAQLPTLLQYAGSSTGYMTNEALAELCYVQSAQIEALQRTVKLLMEALGKTHQLHTLYSLRDPTGLHPTSWIGSRMLRESEVTAREGNGAPKPKASPDPDPTPHAPDPDAYYGVTEDDEMRDAADCGPTDRQIADDTFGGFGVQLKLKEPDEDPRDRRARLKHAVASSDYARKLREEKEKGSK